METIPTSSSSSSSSSTYRRPSLQTRMPAEGMGSMDIGHALGHLYGGAESGGSKLSELNQLLSNSSVAARLETVFAKGGTQTPKRPSLSPVASGLVGTSTLTPFLAENLKRQLEDQAAVDAMKVLLLQQQQWVSYFRKV